MKGLIPSQQTLEGRKQATLGMEVVPAAYKRVVGVS